MLTAELIPILVNGGQPLVAFMSRLHFQTPKINQQQRGQSKELLEASCTLCTSKGFTPETVSIFEPFSVMSHLLQTQSQFGVSADPRET